MGFVLHKGDSGKRGTHPKLVSALQLPRWAARVMTGLMTWMSVLWWQHPMPHSLFKGILNQLFLLGGVKSEAHSVLPPGLAWVGRSWLGKIMICKFCFPFPSPSIASAFLLAFSNLEELAKNPYFATVVSLMLGKPYPRREPKASKNVSGLRAVAKVREVSVSPAAKSQMRVKIKQWFLFLLVFSVYFAFIVPFCKKKSLSLVLPAESQRWWWWWWWWFLLLTHGGTKTRSKDISISFGDELYGRINACRMGSPWQLDCCRILLSDMITSPGSRY